MPEKEMIKNSLEEFANIQEYVSLIKDKNTEKVLYDKLITRYQLLKAFLTGTAGINMTDIDKLKL